MYVINVGGGGATICQACSQEAFYLGVAGEMDLHFSGKGLEGADEEGFNVVAMAG